MIFRFFCVTVTVPLPSRYRSVTVPLPFLGLIKHRYLTVTSPLPHRYLTVTHRYSPLLTLLTVTDRYSPLLTVTHRYSPLLTVTHRYRYSPFFWKFNIFFIAVLKLGGTSPAFQNFNGMNVHERSWTFANVRCSLSFTNVRDRSQSFAIVPDRLFLLRKFI